MHVYAERVKDTSTTTGTGSITVSGTPASTYQTLSAVCAVGDMFEYVIEHTTANEWEVGLGTYSSSNVFARTKVYASSNSGSAVSFAAGTKNVMLVLSAEDYPLTGEIVALACMNALAFQ